jgi:hypothetical protein
MVINGAGRYGLADPPPPPLSSPLRVLSSSLLRNVALRGGRLGRRLRQAALGLGKRSLRAARLRTSMMEVPCHQDRSFATMARIAACVRDVLAPRHTTAFAAL